jgi:uncharacterized protein YchJ
MGGLACPCGLGEDYASCCGRLHTGAPAPTAESLMRSRYSAFAVADAGYLLRTWHPSRRPRTLSGRGLSAGASARSSYCRLLPARHSGRSCAWKPVLCASCTAGWRLWLVAWLAGLWSGRIGLGQCA